MAGHGVRLEQGHAVDHVAASTCIGSERALPGVAAIEKQNLGVATFGANAVDDRGEPIEPSDAAVSFGKRLETLTSQRIGSGRFFRTSKPDSDTITGHRA